MKKLLLFLWLLLPTFAFSQTAALRTKANNPSVGTFSETLVFNTDKFITHTQTGIINFTLNNTGSVLGKTIRIKLIGNSVHNIYFGSGFFLLGGTYNNTATNYIYLNYAGTNEVTYTISQAITPPVFELTSLSGLVQWYSAAHPTTVTTGATFTWADKSAIANNATQTTAADQPTFNSVNKTVTFDGTDYLSHSSVSINRRSATIFFAVNRTTHEDDIVWGNDSNASQYFMFRANNTFFSMGTGRTITGGYAGGKLLVAIVLSETSEKIYFNGVEVYSGAVLSAGTNVQNVIGRTNASLGQKFEDVLYALAVYNRPLDTSERQQVEAAINTTYLIY